MRLSEMRTEVTPQKINKVMESRFGFAVDYDSLTFKKAYTMARAISESLNKIKATHGIHMAEKNPAIKDAYEKFKQAEEQLKIVEALVKEDNVAG